MKLVKHWQLAVVGLMQIDRLRTRGGESAEQSATSYLAGPSVPKLAVVVRNKNVGRSGASRSHYVAQDLTLSLPTTTSTTCLSRYVLRRSDRRVRGACYCFSYSARYSHIYSRFSSRFTLMNSPVRLALSFRLVQWLRLIQRIDGKGHQDRYRTRGPT